jgi:hypothetical protein
VIGKDDATRHEIPNEKSKRLFADRRRVTPCATRYPGGKGELSFHSGFLAFDEVSILDFAPAGLVLLPFSVASRTVGGFYL